MSDGQEPDEVARWHRWFAIEANNAAWGMCEAESLAEAQREDLLATAYASVYHWRQVGTAENAALGHMLLARVHALRGEGELATSNARRAFAHFSSSEAAPWQMAFAHAVLADAAATSRDAKAHAEHYARAKEIGGALDEEDRAIFRATFDRIPVP